MPVKHIASSRKRLTRLETRAYTAKRQKREKQDNNETKKQEDNKEETTGTATAIKQAARVKRQRHHKQEPADEAQKQSEAKEKISEQQKSIKDVVSSLQQGRRSLTAKTQKQEEKDKKETKTRTAERNSRRINLQMKSKQQQDKKKETATKRKRREEKTVTRETTSKQKERKKRQRKTRSDQIHDREAKYVYRSNMLSLIRFFNATKLENEHFQILKKTPFFLLVDILSKKKVQKADSIKYDDVVAKILQTYQMDGTTFEIGGKKLKLKRNDFKLIFGIACGQKKMHLVYGRKDDIDLVKRRKIRENRMTSASIQKLITKLLRSKKKEDREDVVRLVCLLICLLLLYPGTGTTIGWGFMKYLEDIDKMKSYDWCDAAKQHLRKSIERNINQIDKVSGCVMVILYWICEHTSTIKPNAKNAIPIFVKWNITCLGQKLASSSLQELKDIVENNLKHTDEEKKTYRMLLGEIQDKDEDEHEHEDEDADFQQQNQAEISEIEEQTLTEDKSKHKIWKPIPHETCPEKKKKTVPFESQKSEGNKVDKEPEVEPNLVEVLVFERIEDDMLKMEKLKMERDILQTANDNLQQQLNKLKKEMQEQHKKQMQRKDEEIKILHERIATLAEANKYSEEQHTQQQPAMKKLKTSNEIFNILPEKSRQNLIAHWANTKKQDQPVWQGSHHGTYVYLNDIDKILKGQDLAGIVIDAYAEHLLAQKQGTTSFVFISSCHCTSSWKFYNSMRPRGALPKDPHFNAANEVRQIIEKYIKHENPTLIHPAKFEQQTDKVINSPQQDDTSLDCGILVCYIIRPYVSNKNIMPTFTKEECNQLRADMLTVFLTDQQAAQRQIPDQNIDDLPLQ
ncbi:unnamed protein product [Camellia sinensis]